MVKTIDQLSIMSDKKILEYARRRKMKNVKIVSEQQAMEQILKHSNMPRINIYILNAKGDM